MPLVKLIYATVLEFHYRKIQGYFHVRYKIRNESLNDFRGKKIKPSYKDMILNEI